MRVYKPSGIKWLGEIPQSWEVVKGDFVFSNKKELNSNLQCQERLALTLNGVIEKDINQNDGLNPMDFSTYQIFEKNDLVFKLIDLDNVNTSRVGYVYKKGIMSSAYIRLIIGKKSYAKFFYYYYFSLYINQVFNNLGTGVRATLNPDELLAIKIPLPPLQEQKEIAEFLDKKCEKIQNYINKKQKLITLLQEKKQALINKVVTKGLNPNIEFKNSEIAYLGLIPHHWEAVKVKFTAYVKGRIGFHGLNSNEFRYDEGAYLVTGNDFDNNEVMWDKCRRVSEERFYEDPNIHLQNNDLLITKDGTIGKTAIVNNCPKQATLNSGIFLVRTMKKMCFVKYLFFIINSQYFKEFVNVKTSGSTIKHLYQSDFHDLKIPLPPLQEQKQIANFLDEKCEKINSAIEKTKRQIELIKEYKNTLINEAVCGRINFLEGILNE
ncbi:restriction endonuclease subunit S [Campylobacter upsaliensis]|nr:restriction endonuclease subunit S [Campylobacter upsaliensis]